MKLWISGEIDVDIGDEFRNIIFLVEDKINKNVLSFEKYGRVKSWDIILIIMKDDSNYPEIFDYNKRTKEFEFRLKVSHRLFKNFNTVEKEKLIYEVLLRSIKLMPNLAGDDINTEVLLKNFCNYLDI